MNNKECYESIFLDLFDIEKKDLEPDFTFKDNEVWDSLAHLSLISELEEAFDVLFDSDDILNYGSYNNGIKILEGYGVEF